MTSITGVNNASQASTSALTNKSNSMSDMDGDAFLQMLMVQLNFQDPTAPMDSKEIVSQLADLTSVTAMNEMKTSVNDLSGQLYSSQALYASTLVGEEVTVLANVMDIEAGETIEGEILLTTPANNLKIDIYNDKDELVGSLPLGVQNKSGAIAFDTASLEKELPAGKYTLKAMANIDGREIEAAITQRTNVTSVVVPGPGKEVMIEVDKIGLVPLSYITKLQGETGTSATGGNADGTGATEDTADPTKTRSLAEMLGELGADNKFFNKELLRRYPGLLEAGTVSAPDTAASGSTATSAAAGNQPLTAMPVSPAALAMARNA